MRSSPASRLPAKSIRQLLEETSWVQALPTNARDRILLDTYEQSFQVGELVARRGEPASSWIGVADGLLKISAVHRSGKVVMFTEVPEGSWIGEGSVIKREPRRYDVVAMRPSRILLLPGSTMRWLLDTCIEFNHLIIARLNERLAQYIAMVEIDRLSDPVARVARAIGTLYNPLLYPHMNALLSLSQSELGELIGLSRHSVSSALKQLESEGLIATEYGRVLVRKLSALAAYQERDAR